MLKALQRYTIRGFLWYQGESNVGKEKTYVERLRIMAELWRKEWGKGELPFYLVEIAPYDYGEGISGALLREAQFQASSLIPIAVWYVLTIWFMPTKSRKFIPAKKKKWANDWLILH